MRWDIDHLTPVVEAATGREGARVATVDVSPADHRIENMTTRSLDRVSGTLDDGTSWSMFAKTLQPASESAEWQHIPPEFHAQVLEDLDWLAEPCLYESTLAGDMPPGIRLPAVYGIDRTGSAVTIWMEDVADPTGWDHDRYRRSAHLLGRLAGRWPERRATAELGASRRDIGRMFSGKISNFDLPILADDTFWDRPEIRAVAGDTFRADLARLAAAMPAMLDRVAGLPHALGHGDAAPDNLREPGDGTIVGIDWSYTACMPLGSDLGQLLVGRVESGAGEATDLETIAGIIVAGYAEGLAAEGVEPDLDHIEAAFATWLAVRSVFSALIVDHRPDLNGEARAGLIARRATAGRFGLDLALRIAGS